METPRPGSDRQLKIIETYLMNMPSLSTTAKKVIAVCNSPSSSANDINRIISLDPVLTGNVLKLINSAYYSMRDHVTSLTKAIVMLGLNTIKNLALSTAVLGTLNKNKKSPTMDDFWSHSIITGITAKHIAAITGVPLIEREVYFVSGLLHDLGKIPLIQCFPKGYATVIESSLRKQISMNRSEKIIFGINHSMTGKMIAKKWSLRGPVYEVICYHHDPDASDPAHLKIVRIIALANLFSSMIYKDYLGAAIPRNVFLNDLLTKVAIEWRTLAEEKDAILEEIDKAKVFLQIT